MAYTNLGTITTNSGGTYFKYIGPGNTYNANQSFKPSISGTNRVNAFQWYGKTDGTVNVYLKSNGGTTLASTTTNSSTLGWHSISFGYVTVSSSSTYYIVFAPQNGAYIWMYHTNANTYANGSAYVGTGTSVAGSAESDDYAIKITCYEYYTAPATPATPTTSSIGSTSFSAASSVASDGGDTITSRGFCYSSTTSSPTLSHSVKTAGSGTGSFSASLTGLSPGVTYYVRAYATNGAGTSYSATKTQITNATTPSVTTGAVTGISFYTATVAGNVTANGGASVTERGVCFSTSENPTINDGKGTTGTGTGSYTSDLSGMIANTKYYARAYATNSVGTAYGAQTNFTTDIAEPIVTIDGSVTSITNNSGDVSGEVTDSGGATVTERGFCYSLSPTPTIADSTEVVTGTTGVMSATLSGLALASKYYVRAYATNSEGTGYSSEIDFTTLPLAPSALTASNQTKTTVDLSWTKGSGGTYTIVRRGLTPPSNAVSGDLVYNGTASSCTDSAVVEGTQYYYRAWASTTADGLTAVSANYSADDITTVADFADAANAQTDDTNYATVAASDGKLSCRVSFDGGTTWSNRETLTFGASVEALSFGDGTGELWGSSPTGADITDANLRVRLFDDTDRLSYQTYKTFGFAIDPDLILTGLEVKVNAAYDGSNILLYYVKADPYYGTSVLPIGEGSLAYDSDETLPAFYTGTEWKTLATQDTVEATLEQVYPVGSVYINASDSTNPATLLGFGTWSAFGAGRVPVGIDSTDTDFDTAEETGGTKTHTLTESEMPSHTHTQDSHNHSQNSHDHGMSAHNHSQYSHGHQFRYNTNMGYGGYHGPNSTGSLKPANTWVINATASNYSATSNPHALTATNNATTATNQDTGGDGAHNNVQPYITVYMWKRTA